jgi:hypothetical protein
VQRRALVRAPGARRLLLRRTIPLTLDAFARVHSADARADQRRRHQPADGAADGAADDVCADVIADVSRRCAPRSSDAAEPFDGAGLVPWYRQCCTSRDPHGTPEWFSLGDRAAVGMDARRCGVGCTVLAGTSAVLDAGTPGYSRAIAAAEYWIGIAGYSRGTTRVLDCACRAVVHRCVRVRCRGQQRVPGGLRADRDRDGVPHRGDRRG